MVADMSGEAIQGRATQALHGDEPFGALRRVAAEAIDAGVDRAVVLTLLEQMREGLDDDREDLLLEVMDLLTGFCGPEAEL